MKINPRRFALLITAAFLIIPFTVLVVSLFKNVDIKTPRENKKDVLNSAPGLSPSPLPTSSLRENVQVLGDKYVVEKVIDGDTIVVEKDGERETLRLIGVDTPETVDPRKPVQCFGKEASNFTKSSLQGKNVQLESDLTQGDRDKYKRILRYIFLEDGANFNKLLISEGYAHEYTYQENPYKYQAEFKEAERQAREQKKGLWAENACSGSQKTTQDSTSSSYVPQGTYNCDCNKFCTKMASCDEAYYQLQKCGCTARDADGDGVPCESLCSK